MADTFSIYEDQENRVPGVGLKHKRDTLRPKASNGQTVTNRTAFGLLSTSQTNNIRIQPSRSAKQVVNSDGDSLKHGQDENAYAKPKIFAPTTTSAGPSFTIYCDVSAENSKSANSSALCDKNSLQYAATKLQDLPIPDCLTALHRPQPLVSSSSSDMMDMGVTDEDSTAMSVTTPCRPQEDLLKIREEQMWDMTEYAADIYDYLMEAEKVHRPRVNYMAKQTDISTSMRWILIDWMVEVSEEYNLSTETLYLAVSYIDRFLSHMSVKRDKLQLVGTTAMFIAAKYEEIYPPDVAQFAYITDNTYKVAHILRMEHLILKVLSFDMAVPTAYTFINKFSRTLCCTEATTCLALFIAELTMLDSDPFLRFLPSQIAATALAIANFTQGHTPWPRIMESTYHYTLEDLRECYVNLNRTYSKVDENPQHAIREKYKAQKMCAVSTLKARSDLPF